MKNTTFNSWFSSPTESLKHLFLVFLAIIFLVELVLHLRSQMTADGGFLHYVAYLINEHGFVPYRDIFEPNMPATYLFHMSIGNLLGYSNLAFYIASSIWLILTLIVTWFLMKTISKTVALAACLFVGLTYLQVQYRFMALERDFVLILPIATAILLAVNHNSHHFLHFLLGVLFAIAALFKPHALIGLPAVILFSLIDNENKVLIRKWLKPFIVGSLFATLGVLMTVALPLLWLWQIDALASFWEIMSSYTPLYAQMSGDFVFKQGFDRVWYIIGSYLNFGGYPLLVIATLFALYFILKYASAIKTKKLAVLLLVLTVLYSLYAAMAGKFWEYHWMPCVYFASLSAAMLFFSPPDTTYQQQPYPKILPALMFIGMVAIYLPITHIDYLYKKFADVPNIQKHIMLNNEDIHTYSHPNTNIIITDITRYLKTHLEPNDTVQPLSWVAGIQAMLSAKAVLATRYINDFQFYHDVSNSYIQRLRTDFIRQLEQKKPKFIFEVQRGWPYQPKMFGADVNYTFPELVTFVQTHYQVDYVSNGFVIFRRN